MTNRTRSLFKLLKPSCLGCKFFNPGSVSGASDIDPLLQSTCKKFLVNPMQNTFADRSGLQNFHCRDRHPYALMSRLDVSMCGLQGTFFVKA